VRLLAEFSRGAEAVLLYDLDVERLGTLRVAEHFTVADGRISQRGEQEVRRGGRHHQRAAVARARDR
jgi:hypothetical protein